MAHPTSSPEQLNCLTHDVDRLYIVNVFVGDDDTASPRKTTDTK